MTTDPVDRALAHEPAIEPDPEFTAAVMAAVHRETTVPPIAFPWRRFFAGLVASVSVPAVVASFGVPPPSAVQVLDPLGWVVSTLLGSWACYLVAHRLVVGPRS